MIEYEGRRYGLKSYETIPAKIGGRTLEVKKPVSYTHLFGAISYPDYAAENGGQWIGRPLLMGRYYVRELSRSEGYELSVQGILASETNREADGTAVVAEAGTARISAGLSDYNDMNADGSWNDFIVESYRTENGYDVVVAGYPEGTRFFRMEVEQVVETVQTITGSTLEPKKDGNGNVVYQTAKGGEYKTDGDGNPIVKDLSDHSKPQAETVPCLLYTSFSISG